MFVLDKCGKVFRQHNVCRIVNIEMRNYIFWLISSLMHIDSYTYYPVSAIEKTVKSVIARSWILYYSNDRNPENVAKKHCSVIDCRLYEKRRCQVKQYR